MKNFLIGMIFSLLLLFSFLLLRYAFELWIAFIISLVVAVIVYAIYTKKKTPKSNEVVLISSATGIFYIVFASIGIKWFSKESIRDLGDIVIPYMNAFIFGVCTIIVFIVIGLTLIKKSTK